MSNKDLLQTPLFDNLRKLINIIDDLRDIGLQQYIKLPRIAVVGTQSAGKSSLLENVVGLDFLPRGSGVVTRRPLELRLVHEPESRGKINPWAMFDEVKDKKFSNFDEVKKTIEDLTDAVAGSNQGIVDKPIKLTIHSNETPDLTLIDLPGITRINIKDQIDIEKVTKDMATRYITDERTIILAVIAANSDMTTSDGLKLAMDIDKENKRTIGCITKIDIMDQGTDAKSMLIGKEVPLKLGFVGIKNRSQQDIINNMKVAQAIIVEQQYFKKHPVYSTMDPSYLGTNALVTKLTTVLFHHIRTCLPDIVVEIKKQIKECETKLVGLGPQLPTTNLEKQQLILNMIIDFTEDFKFQLTGKFNSKRQTELTDDLNGGAAIKMLFNKLYSEFIEKGFKATKEYKDSDIEKAITLHQGDSIPGFPSIDAFLYLINPQLEKLKEPALELLNEVFGFLENLANGIIKRIFSRFPPVMEEVSELSSHILIEQREKAKQLVLQLISSEQEFLFTNDLQYLQMKTRLIPQSRLDPNNTQEKEIDPQKAFLDEIRSKVDAYYSIVIRNIRDTVPKAIGYFLVRQSEEQMQYQIYNEITKKQDMDLLNEPQHIKEERQTVTKTLFVLKNAIKLLKKDPDLAPFLDKVERQEKIQEDIDKRMNSQQSQQQNQSMNSSQNQSARSTNTQQSQQQNRQLPQQQQIVQTQQGQAPTNKNKKDTSLFGAKQ